MTQQMQNDPGAMAPSLEAKLRQFAGDLTPEEQAQLRALQTDDVSGMFSSSLREKAQQVADALTPEEVAHVHRLAEQAGGGAAAGDDADTQGHMVSQDRVQPGPEGTGGGGGLPLPLPNPISVVKFFAQGVRDLPYNRNPL